MNTEPTHQHQFLPVSQNYSKVTESLPERSITFFPMKHE